MKNLATFMPRAVTGIFLLVLSGCTSLSTEGALEVSLFRDDGRTPDREALAQIRAKDYKDGMIFEIKAGDVIFVEFEKSGELFNLRKAESVQIEFTQDLYAYINEKGVFASRDGQEFEPIRDLLRGSLSVEFSMEEAVRKNQLTFTMALHGK